ncbi:TetR/AcrR family transcriptional regulator [Clostridium cellulovorans]|uniref:Regulatory protein TetR n=1 Tax=Clostridium cellulovorans (strain ATCC 35296 / DSM 3052 / OCM 3 / 743B) TaxID=573061 RepID=D9SNF1_CLOC7|nr:TetR/AcrR family transcriptional regulator [Clostridium cellulovorans]ADL53943.1 regulatory protein TetR [Clostridium cellulovorans 743B]
MEDSKKHISRELILETTLSLIDENKSIKDVSLRVIAKKVGCAHTNLYNYFSSLEEIFWETLGELLLIMIEFCGNGVDEETNQERKIFLVFSNLIDFCMNHPGWYSFIWFEPMGGKPSPRVIEILKRPGAKLAELIKIANNISNERAKLIYDILHSYMHGELSKWINKRSFISKSEQTKQIILSRIKGLYRLLLKEGEQLEKFIEIQN